MLFLLMAVKKAPDLAWRDKSGAPARGSENAIAVLTVASGFHSV